MSWLTDHWQVEIGTFIHIQKEICAQVTLPRILLTRPSSVNHNIACNPMKSPLLWVEGRGEKAKKARVSHGSQEDKNKNKYNVAWAWLVRIESRPTNQSVTSSIPSQGTCRVVGQVPSRAHVRGNHTLMFLSLSPSFPLYLKINK